MPIDLHAIFAEREAERFAQLLLVPWQKWARASGQGQQRPFCNGPASIRHHQGADGRDALS
jgi:hypothetical protein